jgi:serine/threonine protein kinase
MTQNGEGNEPDRLRTAIQSQHPGIGDEIQGAINTLRKLQSIAGGPQGRAGPGDASDPSLVATADGSSTPPAGAGSGLDPSDLVDPTAGHAGVSALPVLAAGEAFGRYQIARLLGRGAMGAVYLAYDSQLQRYVALKTPSLQGNRPTIERFFREARTAAQLRSPYICPVYDVGHIGNVYYISMAFIDGEPLGRMIAAGKLKEGTAIAALLVKIARGLQKAHEAGIIHRDLKPDNIMIDSDGEPVVMDFGLARRFDDDIHLTTPGRILGTPAYMSPEQVEGDPKKIGPATDIYSLGVILYQLLAGRLPFKGSLTAVLRQIGSEAPPRPSTVNPNLAADSPLEPICLKMMAKSPADRYAGMADVVQALEKAFTRPTTSVSRPSAWKRMWSWFSQRRATPSPTPPSAAPPASNQQVLDATGPTIEGPTPPSAASPAPNSLEQTSAELSQRPRP